MSGMTETEADVQEFTQTLKKLHDEMGRVIVGQSEVIDGVLAAFFAEGHVLLEGVPGLGKTLLVRTLADATGLDFARVQFTPDLMPADILGTNLIIEDEQGHKQFDFRRGPVFTNILLADEINRATPKTQSALLEAMQEGHVTVGGESHPIEAPFLVLATQNPLEMEGTYPLPEAQLDRFLLNLHVTFPNRDELRSILQRTTGAESPTAERVLDDPRRIAEFRRVVREVPVADDVQERAIQLVLATHPEADAACDIARKYVRYGASPRGLQAIILASKVRALRAGRFHVSSDDLAHVAPAALRHRIILNFEGEAEGITADQIVEQAIEIARR